MERQGSKAKRFPLAALPSKSTIDILMLLSLSSSLPAPPPDLQKKSQNIFNNLGLTQGATIQLDLAPPADGSPRLKVAVRPRSSSSSSSSSGASGGSNNVEPELLPLYSNGDPIAGEVSGRVDFDTESV